MKSTTSATSARRPLRSAAEAEALVIATIQQHADALLRVARRFSYCHDDAADAYQRALEIFLRHSRTLDVDYAHKWLFTVIRHEALAVRKQRQRTIGSEAIDFDRIEARNAPSPEERVLAFETVSRSAEALQRLKPQEVRALWMKASGRSYAEIAAECGWTHTKVNRCLTEGRRSFLRHYSAIEAGEECERWAPSLSALLDGEATAAELAELRPHLRNCAACRADLRAMHRSGTAVTAVFPIAVVFSGSARSTGPMSWLARAYEVATTPVHELVTGPALKFQSAVEAMSAGKVAAVAASAAALAGGGIAAVDSTRPHSSTRPVVQVRNAGAERSFREGPPRPAVQSGSSAGAVPAAHLVRTRPPLRRRAGKASAQREFAPVPADAPRPRVTARPRASRPAAAGSDVQEFAP